MRSTATAPPREWAYIILKEVWMSTSYWVREKETYYGCLGEMRIIENIVKRCMSVDLKTYLPFSTSIPDI